MLSYLSLCCPVLSHFPSIDWASVRQIRWFPSTWQCNWFPDRKLHSKPLYCNCIHLKCFAVTEWLDLQHGLQPSPQSRITNTDTGNPCVALLSWQFVPAVAAKCPVPDKLEQTEFLAALGLIQTRFTRVLLLCSLITFYKYQRPRLTPGFLFM